MVGQKERLVERCRYWVAAAPGRGVSPTALAHAEVGMAVHLMDAGAYSDVSQFLLDAIQHGDTPVAQVAQYDLLEWAVNHPEITAKRILPAELYEVRPASLRIGGRSDAAEGSTVDCLGSATLDVLSATCDIPGAKAEVTGHKLVDLGRDMTSVIRKAITVSLVLGQEGKGRAGSLTIKTNCPNRPTVTVAIEIRETGEDNREE